MKYNNRYRHSYNSRKFLRALILPGLKLSYYGIADWFLLSLFVLPTYLGVRLGFFDLTAFRLFEILLLVCIFKAESKRKNFLNLVKQCSNNIFIIFYLFVVIYTNLLHPSIGTILYWITNGVIVIYCVAYLVLYEYGIVGFLNKIKGFSWILCIVSPLELVVGKAPFSFLDTLDKSSSNIKSGFIRIMGNCSTTNGYGMYLMILLPLLCYDWEKKCIDFGKNKWLILLMILNIFLTGSRLTIGTLIIWLFLCMIKLQKNKFLRLLLALFIILPAAAGVCYLLRDIGFFNNILRTFFSAFDQVFDTNYAASFGADPTALYNSSHYRELLWKNTIGGDWLNPWLGKGGNYNFGMYIEGYRIFSIDNFYVAQYITYAWPGVITWLVMSASFLFEAIKIWCKRKDELMWVIIVSIICYFISLWFLDQLQTFPIMMAIFGLIYACSKIEDKKVKGIFL